MLNRLRRWPRLARYLTAGGTAAGVNLGSLFILTDWLGWWYLVASVVAFILSLAVSFTLQKWWTFQDHTLHRLHLQAPAYLLIALINLILNTLLIYLLVEVFSLWYVLAQAIASGLIAVGTFFVYRHLVFAHYGKIKR